jgi:hypothetical protein
MLLERNPIFKLARLFCTWLHLGKLEFDSEGPSSGPKGLDKSIETLFLEETIGYQPQTNMFRTCFLPHYSFQVSNVLLCPASMSLKPSLRASLLKSRDRWEVKYLEHARVEAIDEDLGDGDEEV